MSFLTFLGGGGEVELRKRREKGKRRKRGRKGRKRGRKREEEKRGAKKEEKRGGEKGKRREIFLFISGPRKKH